MDPSRAKSQDEDGFLSEYVAETRDGRAKSQDEDGFLTEYVAETQGGEFVCAAKGSKSTENDIADLVSVKISSAHDDGRPFVCAIPYFLQTRFRESAEAEVRKRKDAANISTKTSSQSAASAKSKKKPVIQAWGASSASADTVPATTASAVEATTTKTNLGQDGDLKLRSLQVEQGAFADRGKLLAEENLDDSDAFYAAIVLESKDESPESNTRASTTRTIVCRATTQLQGTYFSRGELGAGAMQFGAGVLQQDCLYLPARYSEVLAGRNSSSSKLDNTFRVVKVVRIPATHLPAVKRIVLRAKGRISVDTPVHSLEATKQHSRRMKMLKQQLIGTPVHRIICRNNPVRNAGNTTLCESELTITSVEVAGSGWGLVTEATEVEVQYSSDTQSSEIARTFPSAEWDLLPNYSQRCQDAAMALARGPNDDIVESVSSTGRPYELLGFIGKHFTLSSMERAIIQEWHGQGKSSELDSSEELQIKFDAATDTVIRRKVEGFVGWLKGDSKQDSMDQKNSTPAQISTSSLPSQTILKAKHLSKMTELEFREIVLRNRSVWIHCKLLNPIVLRHLIDSVESGTQSGIHSTHSTTTLSSYKPQCSIRCVFDSIATFMKFAAVLRSRGRNLENKQCAFDVVMELKKVQVSSSAAAAPATITKSAALRVNPSPYYSPTLEAALQKRPYVLIVGEPGSGKTEALRAVAGQNKIVKISDLVFPGVGESARQLRSLFFRSSILCFDDIDAWLSADNSWNSDVVTEFANCLDELSSLSGGVGQQRGKSLQPGDGEGSSANGGIGAEGTAKNKGYTFFHPLTVVCSCRDLTKVPAVLRNRMFHCKL